MEAKRRAAQVAAAAAAAVAAVAVVTAIILGKIHSPHLKAIRPALQDRVGAGRGNEEI